MITGLAHTAICVPGVEGDAITADMGELTPNPRLKAAIVGFAEDGDRTTWFVGPWGVVFNLVEKSPPERPYYAQRG